MTKVLIITHLWSLIIAVLAWCLQRDKDENTGTCFPTPRVWLGLIALCFMPAIIIISPVNTSMKLNTIEIFDIITKLSNPQAPEEVKSFNYMLIYMVLASLFLGQTLWQWIKLQSISLISTANPNIYITASKVPPLTLSWPQRAVVIPKEIKKCDALIRHEEAHLQHHDAEMTLGLLLLKDIMLRNLGISFLVRQWRLAIELRADHAATKMLTTIERQNYAELLLHGLNPSGDHAGGKALPCPTAHLTSTRHRSVKMRLTKIMEKNSNHRKRRWRVTLAFTAMSATTLGVISTGALAEPDTEKADEKPIAFAKRIPPIMPERCPGLDPLSIKITGKELNIDGKPTYMHMALVGEVKLTYDIRPDGTTHNIRITKSNHPCFEANAKASLVQWVAKPESANMENATVMLRFMLTGETHLDIERPLNKFLR